MPDIKLSPSAASRWMHCTASALLEGGAKSDNVNTRRGREIHAYAEAMLRHNFFGEEVKHVRDPALNIPAADYNASGASLLQMIDDILAGREPDVLLTEFKLASLSPVEGVRLSGTADCIIVVEDELHIIDLKSGFRHVSALHNEQLKIYLVLAYAFFYCYDRRKFNHFAMHIAQPSSSGNGADRSSSHQLTESGLYAFERKLNRVIRAVKSRMVQFKPSADVCRYCPHTLSCASAHSEVKSLHKFADLPELDLSKKYASIKFAEELVTSLKQKIYDYAVAGGEVEGYELVPGRTTIVWRPEAVAEMIARLHEEGFKPEKYLQKEKLLSPKQVIKNCPGVELNDSLTQAKTGAPVLKVKSNVLPDSGARARLLFNIKAGENL